MSEEKKRPTTIVIPKDLLVLMDKKILEKQNDYELGYHSAIMHILGHQIDEGVCEECYFGDESCFNGEDYYPTCSMKKCFIKQIRELVKNGKEE